MTHSLPIFVLHVREGYEDRAAHIDAMMARLGLPFEYMLDGDKCDLTPEVLDRYFTGDMKTASGATSCAYKHLLVCRAIVERKLSGALVLEDDIVLTPRYEEVAHATISELPAGIPSIVSYEDTRLRFVPRSMRRKGKFLYPGDRDRYTGALYVNAEAARTILEEAEKNKLDRPIDLYHRHLLETGKIHYWWSHPCTASQGSFNGMFSTSIDANRGKVFAWKAKRLYRKLLYFFR